MAGMGAYTFNPSTTEAETSRSLSSGPARAIQGVFVIKKKVAMVNKKFDKILKNLNLNESGICIFSKYYFTLTCEKVIRMPLYSMIEYWTYVFRVYLYN